MKDDVVAIPISLDEAKRLCEEIRTEFSENQWHTSAARWCWSCQEQTEGDPANRAFIQKPGNRGCILINARFQGDHFPV